MKILILTTLLLLGLINSGFGEEDQQVALVATPVAPKIDLAQAYKREYLFLTTQKRQLTERLERYKRSTQSELIKSTKHIEVLEKKYLELTREVERESENLAASERNLETVSNEKEALDSMLERSLMTLSEVNKKAVPDSKELSVDEKLLERFKLASLLISNASAVSVKDGNFFKEDGQKVSAEIVELGRVATFGIYDDQAYLLAPAGGAAYKVWKSAEITKIKAIKAGKIKDALELYLHESSNKEVIPKEGKTFSDIMKAAGTIGWVILSLGILTLIMVIIRAVLILRAGADSKSLVSEIAELLANGQNERACELLNERADQKSAISRLVRAIVTPAQQDKLVLEDVASEQMIKEWAIIDKFGTLIIVAASVAPLLGLLGTVTGMIATFDIITEFGTGDPKMLSSGISEALVTTMMGLIVAIPALMLGSILSAQSDKIKSKMEQTTLIILNSMSLSKN